MVLDKDILTVRRDIGRGHQVETFATALVGRAYIGDYAQIAHIGQGLHFIAIVESKRHIEHLAYIVIDLGDDVDTLVDVVIHQGLAVVFSLFRINKLDGSGHHSLLGHIAYGRFFEIDNRVIAIRLVVITKCADKQVVGVVIDPA